MPVDRECKHLDVTGNTCNDCYEVLWKEMEDNYFSYKRSGYSINVKDNRVTHFINLLDKVGLREGSVYVVDDFKDFLRVYDSIEKVGRKNFLLNKYVLWQLLERMGIMCVKCKIKNIKSREEHEWLTQEVFFTLG